MYALKIKLTINKKDVSLNGFDYTRKKDTYSFASITKSHEVCEHWEDIEKIFNSQKSKLKNISKIIIVINDNTRIPSIIIPPKMLKFAGEIHADIEIQTWLEERKENQESKKSIQPTPTIHLKSNQPAPKTGRYQATLPNEHPRAEFLKSSGFDVKTVKEGQSVGTFGFSGSDEDAIVWVYLGE